MSQVATSVDTIERTLHKTNEWLKEIEAELGVDDRRMAFQCLRAVLHVLRDRLPVEEAAHLGSQLPLLVRGMYYESFNPTRLPIKDRSEDDFLSRIVEQLPGFDVIDPERVTRSVFRVLKRHVSEGEIQDVITNFPKALAPLWK